MKIKKVIYTSDFLKSIKKISPKTASLINKRERIFLSNCFDKRLKTHKLKGKLESYWSFSITYSHRILFRFIGENKVLFLIYGTHRIYK